MWKERELIKINSKLFMIQKRLISIIFNFKLLKSHLTKNGHYITNAF